MSTADPFASREANVIHERRTLVPTFAPQIQDEDFGREVIVNGEPQGFTLGQVAREYRWAICPNDSAPEPWNRHAPGEALTQEEFRGLYEQWYGEHFTILPPILDGDPAQPIDDAGLYLPRVDKFIRKTESDGKIIDIDFDPSKRPAISSAKLRKNARGYRDVNDDPDAARAVGESEQDRVDRQAADSKLSKIEELSALLGAGDITPETYARRTQDILGTAPIESAEPVEDPMEPEPTFSAPCGFEAKSKAGAAAHARRCHACAIVEDADLAEPTEETPSEAA